MLQRGRVAATALITLLNNSLYMNAPHTRNICLKAQLRYIMQDLSAAAPYAETVKYYIAYCSPSDYPNRQMSYTYSVHRD